MTEKINEVIKQSVLEVEQGKTVSFKTVKK